MENIWSPLCMKTFGNGRKALQRNVKLSQLYNCTFEKMTNKVSTRCQICNHLPRKKCKSSYLSFVCRQKIIFVFVFAFVISFWREGRGQKKMIFWKNGGGGGNKMGVLIIGQSLRPTDTLRECNIIKLIDY